MGEVFGAIVALVVIGGMIWLYVKANPASRRSAATG